jgi:hypothetical protein
MAKDSRQAKVDKQYKAFIKAWYALEDANEKDDVSDKQAAAAWEAFWNKWVVSSVSDFWGFVSLHMHINSKGVPVVYPMHDDFALDLQDSQEIKFEDLVSRCWSMWECSKDTDAEIEARLRKAFEAGLKKAKKAHFDI